MADLVVKTEMNAEEVQEVQEKGKEENGTIHHDDDKKGAESFEALDIDESMIKALKEKYKALVPTQLQEFLVKHIPVTEHYCLVGSRALGKSTAGVMAALKTVDFEVDKVQVLYLAYTQSVVNRIGYMLQNMAGDSALKLYRAISGSPINGDIRTLFRTVNHVVVGNAGRLAELVRQKATDFSGVKMIILDQADLLFSRSFRPKILSDMLENLPPNVKILILSRPSPRDRNMREFMDKHMGGKKALHKFRTSRTRSVSEGMSPASRAKLRPLPEKTLRWALLSTVDVGKIDTTVIGKYMTDLVTRMKELSATQEQRKIDFDEEPVFINEIDLDGAKEKIDTLKQQVAKAKAENVDVVFFTTPLRVSRGVLSRVILDAAKDGIMMHAVRVHRYAEGDRRSRGGAAGRRRRSASGSDHEEKEIKEEPKEPSSDKEGEEETLTELTEKFIGGHLSGLIGSFRRMLTIQNVQEKRRDFPAKKRQIHVSSAQAIGDVESAKAAQTVLAEQEYSLEGPATLEFKLMSLGGAAGDGDPQSIANLDVESLSGSNGFQVRMKSGRLMFRLVKQEDLTVTKQTTAASGEGQKA